MPKAILILLLGAVLFSCKSLQNNEGEFRNINKHLVCFNYTSKEICLVDIDTGNIDRKHRIEMDIIHGLNSQWVSYEWFYKENDNNVYLGETSLRGRMSRIYKINIDNFEISEIFETDLLYFHFFIENNNLYLMTFDPSRPSEETNNYDLIYIILHNLLNKEETIINFNGFLPENERVRVSKFFISENRMIFIGYREIYFRTLFIYNLVENTIEIIDEPVDHFSIHNEIVIYDKIDVERIPNGVRHKGRNLFVYNLRHNTYEILPPYRPDLFRFLIFNENTIIYTYMRIYPDPEKINPDECLPHPTERYMDNYIRQTDFYIASTNIYNSKLFFSSDDDIMLLGVKDKN